ncbi:MAG: outer membrane protein assembly factor BamB family protein, partial [Planctomycetota bacterium]
MPIRRTTIAAAVSVQALVFGCLVGCLVGCETQKQPGGAEPGTGTEADARIVPAKTPGRAKPKPVETAAVSETKATRDDKALAREILAATGVKGGLIVHLGCGDGRLTQELRASESYLVHGLDTDPDRVARARKRLLSLGLGGKVSVDRLAGDRLPYVDNLVNLVVAHSLPANGIAMKEVTRVLCPNGIAYIAKDGKWTKTVKPRPKEIDEWTHYLHDASNNAVAHDSVVGPPRRMQWVGSPRWSRHHDHMSSVSAVVTSGGRVFTIFDESPRASILIPPQWKLIARDAFNGTILWKRPIDTWHTHMWRLKSGPAQLPRRLVATGETVYVTLGLDAPLSALDASTGKTIRTYEGSAGTEEVIASGGVLFALVRPLEEGAGATQPTSGNLRGHVMEKPWNKAKRRLVALRAGTGEILWQAEHAVAPLTLAADAGRVYFHDGANVVCLDRANGKELWRSEPVPVLAKITPNVGPILVVYKDVVIFAGFEKMIHHRGGRDTMTALAASTGEKLWTAPHPPSGCVSPEDLLVADGLVWTAATTVTGDDGVFTGRDPHTGEVKVTFPPDVDTYWFHHRCHRGKATDRYLLMSRTGIEFVDHAN